MERQNGTTAIEPAQPKLKRGQEVVTIAAMAASARSVMAERRPIKEVLEECMEIGDALAEDGFYSIPFKTKDGETRIEGPTTQLAEMVTQAYGNCLVGSTLERETDDAFLFQAVFVNTRTGAMRVKPFRQRKKMPGTERAFAKDPERGLEITFAIGEAKATRNVITKALPLFVNAAYKAAQESAAKDGRVGPSAKDWKAQYVRAGKLGFDNDQLKQFLGKAKDQLGTEDFDRLRDTLSAIEAGDLTVAQALGEVEDLAAGAKEA